VGLRVQLFGSAPEFLQSKLADVPSCLILDIRLPRVSGLDFQADLAEAGIHIPIIFMTGHGDIPMTVRAMKAGDVDFLTKPFEHNELIRKIAGGYRLYSRKKDPKTGRRRNLGTFSTRAAAEKHERAVQYFKRH
jgi:FixJ family two-component response regulator